MVKHGPDGMEEVTTARRLVAPFMLVAAASLLLGMWTGLARIGWQLPQADAPLMLRHGGLMVVGFVGTVIAVERAVAVRSIPAFAAPALSAAAGLALLVGASRDIAPALATAAGFAYSLNVAILLARHRMLPFAVALVGALCFFVANAVWWRGGAVPEVVPWWMSFLILTIVAERLEIVRFQRFTRASIALGGAALLLLVLGPAAALAEPGVGGRLLGAGCAVGALWLVRRDIALRTVRTDGLARFAAVGVLSAYAWLTITGLLLVAWGLEPGGLRYDALIHAFFIGFVFSAIIAHEPIIAPAVTGLRFTFTPLMYVPLAILDGALVVRVLADLLEASGPRRWSGLVQVVAILLFLAISVFSVLAGRRSDATVHATPRPAAR